MVRRRDFLRAGSLAALGLSVRDLPAAPSQASSCIFLMLVGGPSHLDTFDMKPHAPTQIRGPFRPIRTNVPGMEISEIFPRTARHADKFSLIRSLHHEAAPVHDTGHQLMQTGRLFEDGLEHPHYGSVVAKLTGSAHALLPCPIGNTGGNMPHGQSAGFLGEAFDPILPETLDLSREPEKLREKYGLNRFGQSCLAARALVEAGMRFVTVNMFDTVFDQLTWDIHGSKPFSPMDCYRDVVGPMFDMAYSSLLEDLSDRGLLSSTMVVATGEFGRTPKINPAGGRDHWPQCWTMLIGGGPLKGGQVIGASDRFGFEPKDRAVTPGQIAATIYKGLGIDPATELRAGVSLVDRGVEPVHELFI